MRQMLTQKSYPFSYVILRTISIVISVMFLILTTNNNVNAQTYSCNWAQNSEIELDIPKVKLGDRLEAKIRSTNEIGSGNYQIDFEGVADSKTDLPPNGSFEIKYAKDENRYRAAIRLYKSGTQIATCGYYTFDFPKCDQFNINPNPIVPDEKFKLSVSGLPDLGGLAEKYLIKYKSIETGEVLSFGKINDSECMNNNACSKELSIDLAGDYQVFLDRDFNPGGSVILCRQNIRVCESLDNASCTPIEQIDPNEVPLSVPRFEMCLAVLSSIEEQEECESCVLQQGIWTAFGCISTDPIELTKQILTIAISLSGGITLLLILYGAFTIASSSGDPQKVERGKEIIMGAVAGLLFIIFAVVMLNIIGVEILQIPGL